VCTAEVPIPYAKHLEEAALPQPEKIVAAVQGLFGDDRQAGAQRLGVNES
jgi:pyruvate dehydrogenase E1 component beta subunit